MFVGVRVVEGSFQGEGVILQGFNVPLMWLVPVYNPFAFVSEAIDFLKVSVANQGLVVVANGGFGPRNVIGVECSHK